MIKSELITAISHKLPHLLDKDVMLAVNKVIDKIGSSLAEGMRVEIRGFGSFCLRYRPPRRAHNPKTGEKLLTEPKYVVYFKPGKDMRDRVDANSHLPIKEAGGRDDDEDE